MFWLTIRIYTQPESILWQKKKLQEKYIYDYDHNLWN